MTLYLCEWAGRCSDFSCYNHKLHEEERNDKGRNMCKLPTPCIRYTIRLFRCLICEEEEVYFIKKGKT